MPGYRHITKNLGQFDNAAATDGPANQRLPGVRIRPMHEFLIRYLTGGVKATQAEMEAQIPDFDLVIGHEVFCNYKTTNLFMLDQFYGEPINNGELPLRFAQRSRRLPEGVENGSMMLGLHPDVTLRLNMNAAVAPSYNTMITSDDPDPGILGGISALSKLLLTYDRTRSGSDWGDVLGMVSKLARPIIRHVEISTTAAQTGDNVNVLTYQTDARAIRGFHFDNGNLTALTIKKNGRIIGEYDDKAILDRVYASEGYTPQGSNWHVVPEALSGGTPRANFMMNKNDEISLEYKTAVAEVTTVLVEEYVVPKIANFDDLSRAVRQTLSEAIAHL